MAVFTSVTLDEVNAWLQQNYQVGTALEIKGISSGIENSNFFLTTQIDGIQKALIINQIVDFTTNFIGHYPHEKITVSQVDYDRNTFYGLNQLPKFLRPFSDTFKWDITMFKAVSKRYIENTLLLNKRTDYWLIDALQNYLMIEYIHQYYPDVKLLGNASNSWILKKFNI